MVATKGVYLVIATIIIGFIAFIGFRVAKSARIGSEKLYDTKEIAYSEAEISDLELACKAWINGDLYDPKKIYYEYKVIQAMEPFYENEKWFSGNDGNGGFKGKVMDALHNRKKLAWNDISEAVEKCQKIVNVAEECRTTSSDFVKCFLNNIPHQENAG